MKIRQIIEAAGERDVADLAVGDVGTAQQIAGFLQTQFQNSVGETNAGFMEDILHISHRELQPCGHVGDREFGVCIVGGDRAQHGVEPGGF